MSYKTSKSKYIQLIHIARSKLGLSDSDYRAVLDGATGKSSCTGMTEKELREALKALKTLGFTVKKMPVKEGDVGAANLEQIEYIKGMWEVCARIKTEKALNTFIKRLTGVEHLRFLDVKSARKVILALRDMMSKSGFNPDRPEPAA